MLLTVFNTSKGILIGEKIKPAFSFWTRLKGLLGSKGLTDGEGLLLFPCSGIHCFGMRFAIDAIFLDGEGRVLQIREDLRSGAWAGHKGARYVLEISAGQVRKKMVEVGDIINFRMNNLPSKNE